MICRRKHTANFTTIGNALFDDERLAADEVGVLSYLLSRPNDWEVRRPALARRWRVGRERIARILFSLIRYGWIVAKRDRLSNGTFHVIYEVRDDPGPELTMEEAKSATALVSSSADDADFDGEQGGQAEHPDTGDPDAAKPDTGNPLAPIEESLKTDSVKTESPKGVRAFSDVKAQWPLDHILSSVAAEAVFAGLTNAKKEACWRGVKPYLADCSSQGRKVCDLTTFIREERWERFTAGAESKKASVFRVYSPQWYRWRDHRIAVGQSIKFMEGYAKNNPHGTWSEPSDWPPPMPKTETTGPPDQQPGNLCTDDDLKEFVR